jgi:hypothetical protein
MGFSYNYGSNPTIDYPRLLIADTVEFAPNGTTPVYIFDDREILAMYNIGAVSVIGPSGGGQVNVVSNPSPRYVAANLLLSLAGNKARLANALKVLDIQVNTQGAAQELRAIAETWLEMEWNSGDVAIVEQVVDQFSARERLWKQMVRLSVG